MLFPSGIYRQSIAVSIIPENVDSPKEFHFEGVAQTDEGQIKLTALSPLGASIFRLTDDLRTDKIKIEIFTSSLQKFEKQFLEYYRLMKILFIVSLYKSTNDFKVLQKNSEGFPARAEIIYQQQVNEFTFEHYDERKLPEIIEIKNPKVKIKIDLIEYKQMNE